MSHEISPARVILAGLAWRTMGVASAGDTLVRVFSEGAEQNRMLAGMSLVRAGERSVKLIGRKARAGEASSDLIRLLPDFESAAAREVLRELESAGSEELRSVARQCLSQMDRMAQA